MKYHWIFTVDSYNYRNVITFARHVRPADSVGIEKKVRLLVEYHPDYDGEDVMDPLQRNRRFFRNCYEQYSECITNFLMTEYNNGSSMTPPMMAKQLPFFARSPSVDYAKDEIWTMDCY